MCEDKKTEPIKVWVSEKLFADLSRLADGDDRKLSDYITKVLERHAYGHLRRGADGSEGALRGE